VVVPIASETDAAQSIEAMAPHFKEHGEEAVGHVINKAGGTYHCVNLALGPLFGSIAGRGNWPDASGISSSSTW
jgi:hypothetical protein